uniref:Embryo surrounding factor 1 brassicaceae domain-containing protein n=1 Tax=Leersia perrieri TaxID=77586 RepID=A0A0D9XT77_9ORYZ
MAISMMAIMFIMVAQLLPLATTAAAGTSSSWEEEPAITGSSSITSAGDLVWKVGIRRMLLQDGGDCIPHYEVCCSNCGWPFERTNCCDPDNYMCQYWPEMDPAHGQDWCIPRDYWQSSGSS